jgi:ADP-heptose:LPS heptosyltransferase
LIKPATEELVRHHPAVSNIRIFGPHRDKEHRTRPLGVAADWWKLASELRAAKYDLVIDLQGQARSALFSLVTGAPVRLGFDRPRPEIWKSSVRQLPAEAYKHCWQGAREGAWIAYTHVIRLPSLDLHPVDRYLRLVPILGLDDAAPDFSFPIPQRAMSEINNLLAGHGIDAAASPVLIAPGTIWETKHWTHEGFAAAARHFLHRGQPVVLTGSMRERFTCAALAQAAPGSTDLSGRTTVSELAALIHRSAICLTNDSGPMHLAVALDRPVVGIFGPTDVIWAGPYRRPDAFISAGVPCSPCYLRKLSQCPHDHICMRSVSPADVIARMEESMAMRNAIPSPTEMNRTS